MIMPERRRRRNKSEGDDSGSEGGVSSRSKQPRMEGRAVSLVPGENHEGDRDRIPDSALYEELSQEIISGKRVLVIPLKRCDDADKVLNDTDSDDIIRGISNPKKRRIIHDDSDSDIVEVNEELTKADEPNLRSRSSPIKENRKQLIHRTDQIASSSIMVDRPPDIIPSRDEPEASEPPPKKKRIHLCRNNDTTKNAFSFVKSIAKRNTCEYQDPEYAWHCCVLWDTRIKQELEEHSGKYKNQKFTYLGMSELLTKTMAEDNPGMDIWQERDFILVKVLDKGFRKSCSNFIIRVVEVTTEKNLNEHEDRRQLNLVLRNTVDNESLVTEITRLTDSPTLLVIWGFTRVPPLPSSLVVADLIFNLPEHNKPAPEILIFHGEALSENRKNLMRSSFSESELKHFSTFETLKLYRRERYSNGDFMFAVHLSRPYVSKNNQSRWTDDARGIVAVNRHHPNCDNSTNCPPIRIVIENDVLQQPGPSNKEVAGPSSSKMNNTSSDKVDFSFATPKRKSLLNQKRRVESKSDDVEVIILDSQPEPSTKSPGNQGLKPTSPVSRYVNGSTANNSNGHDPEQPIVIDDDDEQDVFEATPDSSPIENGFNGGIPCGRRIEKSTHAVACSVIEIEKNGLNPLESRKVDTLSGNKKQVVNGSSQASEANMLLTQDLDDSVASHAVDVQSCDSFVTAIGSENPDQYKFTQAIAEL